MMLKFFVIEKKKLKDIVIDKNTIIYKQTKTKVFDDALNVTSSKTGLIVWVRIVIIKKRFCQHKFVKLNHLTD